MAMQEFSFFLLIPASLLVVNAITCMFCLASAFQALKVLRAADYAPFVVFIAAPRPQDLPDNQYNVSYNTNNGFMYDL